MKKWFLLMVSITGLICQIEVSAQSDISMSTAWYNRGSYNPAAIARPEFLYLYANTRQQWMGVDGAPRTYSFQVSQYFHSTRSALGLSVVTDKTGLTSVVNPMLNYSYRLSNDQDWALSMGVGLGVYSRFMDQSKFEPVSDNDNSLLDSPDRITRPDANLGFEYQNEHFIWGASVTHLFSLFNNDNSLFLNSNHRYGYFIYKNDEARSYNYSVGMKVINRSNITYLEANGSIRFKKITGLIDGPRELFELGAAFRTSKQAIFLFGINITKTLKVGYTFDQTFQQGYNQNGTHEILLEYRIPSHKSSTNMQCHCTDFWYF